MGSFDLSPDDIIASAAFDSGITLWDLSRGETVGTLDTPSVWSLEFSPDGSRLAALTLAEDEVLRLEFWDTRTSQHISTLDLGPPSANAINDLPEQLAWSPDGSRVVMARTEGTFVLDVATATEVAALPPAQSALITRDGESLVLADGDSVDLWDAATLDGLGPLATVDAPGALGLPPSLAQGPDDMILAVIADQLRAWRLSTREPVELDAPEQVFELSVSRDGRLAAVDGSVWDLTTRRPVAVLETGDSFSGSPGAFTADGSSFVTWTMSGRTQVLPAAPVAGRTFELGPFDAFVVAVVAGDERLTVVGRGDPTGLEDTTFHAALVDPAQPALVQTTALGAGRSVAVSRDGRVVAVRALPEDEIAVRLFDVAAGTALATVPSDGDVAGFEGSVAVSDDGEFAALVRAGGGVSVIEAASGQEVASIPGTPGEQTVVAFTPDEHVAVVSAPSTSSASVSVWDLDGDQVGGPVEFEAANVVGAATSADGRVLMVAGDDAVVEISLPDLDVFGELPPTYPFAGFHPSDAGAGRVAMFNGDGHQIWDLSRGLPIGTGLHGAAGAMLAVGDEAGRPILYGFSAPGGELFMTRRTLDPAEIADELCAKVGKNLTPEQWDQYFPGDRYRETCPVEE
jgi:WD40 repeat protein